MAGPTIMIVDDDPAIRFGLRDFLEAKGFRIEEAASCEAARTTFRISQPDLAILDHSLPDGTAIELLPQLKAIDPDVPLLILTAYGSIDLAVQAIKLGAEQFLTKPVELPALLSIVERLIEHHRNRRSREARRSLDARDEIDPFVGTSRAIRRLQAEAEKVARADSPVLVQGATGCGKGVLARWLHRNSPRSDDPFVDLNCAGLSREFLETELFGHERGAFTGAVNRKLGLLEVAHRGTLFLDEIGDIDPGVQPKLLKVLEERRFRRVGEVRDRSVDIRLIAATHHDLTTRVREGTFRSDLYFRISTVPLRVPPLAERVEDILPLADRLLSRLAADLGRIDIRLGDSACSALQAYPWPGNIRELRNVLERALLLADAPVLERTDLRFETAPEAVASGRLPTLEEMERQHIERALELENDHVERAAERLGIPRSTLYDKLKRYGLRG